VLEQSGKVVNPELLEERLVSRMPTIYLAGPFFSASQRWLVNTFREALLDLGADVRSPFHDVGLGTPHEVALADLEHLSAAHGVLAILDGLDPGTLFEVGYARACGIPVVGFASQSDDKNLTMTIGARIPVYQDLTTAVYQAIWTAASV
jgi:nucleoside 2-deoxyribosyltransferase